MTRRRRLIVAATVLGASLVPAASAFAGMNLGNHNETLLEG